ncbi:ATP-binding cassette domain-containing protein [Acidipropionibacterium timonense]|uniref:ATP-binding cassette domain-containing protein n=1 Tax=Acidipropionibacterium timonense TaxID=2161818 RepID=UPI001436A29C
MESDAPALVIEHLSKSFGPKRAVDDLSLAVPQGCLFGFVGPNGAGKTTTLSMATGLLRPDRGVVRVWGHDVWTAPPAAKALMGILPDGYRTFDRLSGRELLRFCGQLRRMDGAQIDARIETLLDVLGLSGDADTLVCDYSAGMGKKIGLACALLHNPSLLVLDEPFESVDPVSGQTIRSILHQFVAGGGTVVMSSHVMELVESLCDAVAVIAAGRVLAVGTVEAVRGGMSLQDRFVQLVGGGPVRTQEGLSWLHQS